MCAVCVVLLSYSSCCADVAVRPGPGQVNGAAPARALGGMGAASQPPPGRPPARG